MSGVGHLKFDAATIERGEFIKLLDLLSEMPKENSSRLASFLEKRKKDLDEAFNRSINKKDISVAEELFEQFKMDVYLAATLDDQTAGDPSEKVVSLYFERFRRCLRNASGKFACPNLFLFYNGSYLFCKIRSNGITAKESEISQFVKEPSRIQLTAARTAQLWADFQNHLQDTHLLFESNCSVLITEVAMGLSLCVWAAQHPKCLEDCQTTIQLVAECFPSFPFTPWIPWARRLELVSSCSKFIQSYSRKLQSKSRTPTESRLKDFVSGLSNVVEEQLKLCAEWFSERFLYFDSRSDDYSSAKGYWEDEAISACVKGWKLGIGLFRELLSSRSIVPTETQALLLTRIMAGTLPKFLTRFSRCPISTERMPQCIRDIHAVLETAEDLAFLQLHSVFSGDGASPDIDAVFQYRRVLITLLALFSCDLLEIEKSFKGHRVENAIENNYLLPLYKHSTKLRDVQDDTRVVILMQILKHQSQPFPHLLQSLFVNRMELAIVLFQECEKKMDIGTGASLIWILTRCSWNPDGLTLVLHFLSGVEFSREQTPQQFWYQAFCEALTADFDRILLSAAVSAPLMGQKRDATLVQVVDRMLKSISDALIQLLRCFGHRSLQFFVCLLASVSISLLDKRSDSTWVKKLLIDKHEKLHQLIEKMFLDQECVQNLPSILEEGSGKLVDIIFEIDDLPVQSLHFESIYETQRLSETLQGVRSFQALYNFIRESCWMEESFKDGLNDLRKREQKRGEIALLNMAAESENLHSRLWLRPEFHQARDVVQGQNDVVDRLKIAIKF